MARRLARRAGLTALTGVAAAVAMLAAAMPASAAPGDGSAYAADVDVTLLGQSAVSVGPLAASNTNGPTTATLASISVPGILTTGLVSSTATLDEDTGVVHSAASIANANVTLGLATITAGLIQSHCDATQSGVTGGVTLTDVVLGGTQVAANPAPNTTINVLGLLTVVLNEQITHNDGSLTVNAIHIKLNALVGSGDVILASSTCGPAAPPMPMASGAGLWVGLGLLGLIAVPTGSAVLRKRLAAAQA